LLNHKTPEQIVYCLEIPSGILATVLEKLKDAHPTISLQDYTRYSTIDEKIKEPALLLFNVDLVIKNNPKQAIFPTQFSKGIRAIGLYKTKVLPIVQTNISIN